MPVTCCVVPPTLPSVSHSCWSPLPSLPLNSTFPLKTSKLDGSNPPVFPSPAKISWVPAAVPFVSHRPCAPVESVPLNSTSLPKSVRNLGSRSAAAPVMPVSSLPVPVVTSNSNRPVFPSVSKPLNSATPLRSVKLLGRSPAAFAPATVTSVAVVGVEPFHSHSPTRPLAFVALNRASAPKAMMSSGFNPPWAEPPPVPAPMSSIVPAPVPSVSHSPETARPAVLLRESSPLNSTLPLTTVRSDGFNPAAAAGPVMPVISCVVAAVPPVFHKLAWPPVSVPLNSTSAPKTVRSDGLKFAFAPVMGVSCTVPDWGSVGDPQSEVAACLTLEQHLVVKGDQIARIDDRSELESSARGPVRLPQTKLIVCVGASEKHNGLRHVPTCP